MPRKLQREAQLAYFHCIFRECQHETDIDQINEVKQVMYTVIERLDRGIYPPFPVEDHRIQTVNDGRRDRL